MKHSAKKYGSLLLMILVILLLGYYRDFLFRTLNSILQARDYESAYNVPPSLKFLDGYSYSMLVRLKWILTIAFSLLYLSLSLITLRLLFNNRKYGLITIGVYIIVMAVSGIFMFLGVLFQDISPRMYEIARYLMGMAQSPIILMILIPAFKLSGQEPNNISN